MSRLSPKLQGRTQTGNDATEHTGPRVVGYNFPKPKKWTKKKIRAMLLDPRNPQKTDIDPPDVYLEQMHSSMSNWMGLLNRKMV